MDKVQRALIENVSPALVDYVDGLEKKIEALEGGRVLTCVYCGQEYPQGTPASGSSETVLTEHIKVCEKHPMRATERQVKELKDTIGDLMEVIDNHGITLLKPGEEL